MQYTSSKAFVEDKAMLGSCALLLSILSRNMLISSQMKGKEDGVVASEMPSRIHSLRLFFQAIAMQRNELSIYECNYNIDTLVGSSEEMPYLTNWLNKILIHACVSPDSIMDALEVADKIPISKLGVKESTAYGESSLYSLLLRRGRTLYHGAHFETLAQIKESIQSYVLMKASPADLKYAGLQASSTTKDEVIKSYQSSYLHCVQGHRYLLAKDYLHRFFDHAIAQRGASLSQDTSLMYTAALQVAVIHFLSGDTVLAKYAFQEGFRITQQTHDCKYSNLALSWLYHIVPSNNVRSTTLSNPFNYERCFIPQHSIPTVASQAHPAGNMKTPYLFPILDAQFRGTPFNISDRLQDLHIGHSSLHTPKSRALELQAATLHDPSHSNILAHNQDKTYMARRPLTDKKHIVHGLVWNEIGHLNMAALALLSSRRAGLPWMLKPRIKIAQDRTHTTFQPLRWLNKRLSLESASWRVRSKRYTLQAPSKQEHMESTPEILLAERLLIVGDFMRAKMIYSMIMPKLIEHGPVLLEAKAWLGLAKCELFAYHEYQQSKILLRKAFSYLDKALLASMQAHDTSLIRIIETLKIHASPGLE